MSHPVCKNCGATNDVSKAICPYCKSSLGPAAEKSTASSADSSLGSINRLYLEGKLDQAVHLIAAALKDKPTLEEDVGFLILQSKCLIETEAPNAKIKAVLHKACLLAPKNLEVIDYLEIIDAKEKLEFVSKILGEQALEKVIRRSPKNPHAHFLMGAHLFWIRNNHEQAQHHLKQAISSRPNLLRAWACLGALYRLTGQEEQAVRAFRKCLELETNPQMIQYFKSLLHSAA